MTRDSVAARLAGFPRVTADRADLKQAAVAVCAVVRDGLPCLLLTRRAAGLRAHAGQWALPGGRRDDGETPVDGALRELAEEVGLELGQDSSHRGAGVVFAAGAIYVLRYFRVQNMPGSLPSRLGSVLFAAGNLEIILHLFIMSLAVWLARGRIWVGIAAATFFYIGFHSAGAFGQSAPLLACTILLNGSFGVLLGIFYARYGYEYLMLSHAIAHGLAVGLG